MVGYGSKYEYYDDDENESNSGDSEYTTWEFDNNDSQSEDSESNSGDSESEDDDGDGDDDDDGDDVDNESGEEEEDEEEEEEDIDWSNIIVYDNLIYEIKRGDFEYLENGDVKINGLVYDKNEIELDDDCPRDKKIYIRCGLAMKKHGCDENVTSQNSIAIHPDRFLTSQMINIPIHPDRDP